MSKTTLLLETLAWLDSLDVGELPNEDNEHDLSRIIVSSTRSTVSTGTSPANSRDDYYEDERDVVRNRPRKDLREAEIMTSPISIKSKSPNKGITSSSTSPLRIRAPSIFPGISFAIDDDRSTEDDKSSNQSKQNIPTKAAMVSHMTSPIREKRRNSRSVETLTSPGLLAWQAKEDKSEQSTNQDEEDVGNESTSQHRHSFDVESSIEIRDDYLDRKEYERSAKQRGFKKWQHWTKQRQVFVKAKQQQLSLDHNDNHEDKHILWTNERILMRIPAWHSFLRLVKGIRMWKRFIRQRQHFRKHYHLQALLQHKHRHRHHISLQIIPVYIMKYRIHLMITFWRLWQQRRLQKRRKHFLKWKRLLHMTASIHKVSRYLSLFL